MILFDTSVIIDARDPDSPWHSWAKEQIADAVAGDGAGVNAAGSWSLETRPASRLTSPRWI